MSPAQFDMEQVVREVLRRLREVETTLEKTSPAPAAAQSADGVLCVPERLLALSTVQGKLLGLKRLRVERGTIITPAVFDELRARNIELEYAEDLPSGNVGTAQLLVAATTGYNPQALFKGVAQTGIEIRNVAVADWKQAVGIMSKELANTQNAGLLLTDRPAAAACLANRNQAIRAAVATDVRSARQAIETIGANLLAIDPTAHSLHSLRNIVREYARRQTRTCPGEFQGM